jgi:DNA-binding response OmpR family regulator
MSVESLPNHVDRPITLLVVASEARLGDRLSAFCAELDDLTVSQVDTATEALIYLDTESDVDLLISTQNLSVRSGLDLLEQVRKRHPELPFILADSTLSGAEARTAFLAGATDVVQLETTAAGLDVLLARVERAIGVARSSRQRDTDRSSELTTVLSDLQLLVEELSGTRSFREAADYVAAAAVTAAGMTRADVHLFDPTEHRLRRTATEATRTGMEREPTVGLDPLLWETYLTGEPHSLTLPARDQPDESLDGTTGGETVLVPLGRFGVLQVSRAEPDDIDAEACRLAELLGTLATAGFDSVEQ